MTSINFDQEIKDFYGNPIYMPVSPEEGAAKIKATLAVVCAEALLATLPGDSPSGSEKLVRYSLARRIHKGGEVNLKAEEITKVKDLVGKTWAPMLSGPAWEMLDPEQDEE